MTEQDKSKTSTLVVPVLTSDKANYVRQAQAEGKKLVVWVKEQLDKAISQNEGKG